MSDPRFDSPDILKAQVATLTRERDTLKKRLTTLQKSIDLEDDTLTVSASLSSVGHGQVGDKVTETIAGVLYEVRPLPGADRRLKLFHRPYLRQYTDGNVLYRELEERKATWGELFYDLVFVLIIAHLAVLLEKDPSAANFGQLAIMFTAVYQIWSASMHYLNQFDSDDGTSKLFYLIQFIGVLGIGVNSTQKLRDSRNARIGVAGSYLLSRWSIVFLRGWAALFIRDKHVRFHIILSNVSELFSSMFIFISVFDGVGDASGFDPIYWWVIGLGFDYVLTVIIQERRRYPLNTEHLRERHGLFGVIVLGEIVVALLFDGSHATVETYVSAAFGLIIAFSLFALYFDVEQNLEIHDMHATLFGALQSKSWILLHLPMCGSIVTTAVGLKLLIEATTGAHITDKQDRWFFCGGLASCILVLGVLGLMHKTNPKPRVPIVFSGAVRVIGAAGILVLPVFGDRIDTVYLVSGAGCIAGLLAILTTYAMLPSSGSSTTTSLKVSDAGQDDETPIAPLPALETKLQAIAPAPSDDDLEVVAVDT